MKKYTYDAFISYSHNEKDAFAAEQLHKTLEHYHIPKKNTAEFGKKRRLKEYFGIGRKCRFLLTLPVIFRKHWSSQNF
ncbi:MAG: hypothetical protein ACLS5E_05445 [[Ruminococcus] lactaris]